MAKEIKVRLYAHENDDYVELWQTFDEEPKYYGRYTYNDEGTWYSVCDPLGYCELNCHIKDDVTFICCDYDGNEICRYSNADENPLPKFETFVQKKWNSYKANVQSNTEDLTKQFWAMCWDGTHTTKIDKWLLSFKDPELYGDKAKEYDINWVGCWHEHQMAWEPLPMSGFSYLGNRYQFVKVTHKHDICGVEWDEFVCADDPIVFDDYANKDRPWIVSHMYLGNWFDDSKYGTMYDKQTAKEKVSDALKEIYGGKELSEIHNSYGYCYERFIGYMSAAERLLNGNYNVEFVGKLIRDEKGNHTFEIVDDPTIPDRYPGVVRDHKYNYDIFGRRY